MKVHCPIDNQSIVLGRDEEIVTVKLIVSPWRYGVDEGKALDISNVTMDSVFLT